METQTGVTAMLEIQKHGNVWMLVRVNGSGNIVATIRSFYRQAAAVRCMMKLYENGAM